MAEKHFYEQRKHTISYLLPYFSQNIPDFQNKKVLEVGCAEAGLLDVLQENNFDVTGVELEATRVKIAKEKNPQLKIFTADITDINIVDKIGENFDLVIMRDVIEHIPDREALFRNLKKLIKKDGYFYVTFPPRFSGFSGHQQNGKSLLRYAPFLQIFPDSIIKSLGSLFNENPKMIEFIIHNFKIGLTINKFEKFYSAFKFEPVVKDLFLFRPIFKLRYNLTPRKFPNIPVIRELLSFGCEYLLQNKE